MLWDTKGMVNILRDSSSKVAVFDFYGASASTLFKIIDMQNLGCMLNYNDNTNWSISVNVINKKNCRNGWDRMKFFQARAKIK